MLNLNGHQFEDKNFHIKKKHRAPLSKKYDTSFKTIINMNKRNKYVANGTKFTSLHYHLTS